MFKHVKFYTVYLDILEFKMCTKSIFECSFEAILLSSHLEKHKQKLSGKKKKHLLPLLIKNSLKSTKYENKEEKYIQNV